MFSTSERRNSQDLEQSRHFLPPNPRSESTDEVEEFKLEGRFRASCFRVRKRIIVWFLLLGVGAYAVIRFNPPKHSRLEPPAYETTVQVDETGSASVLVTNNGTATFRENLLPSTKYVTAFLFAGFTNQVMEITTLLYLALLNNRVPIVPAFLPDHFGNLETATPTNFGDIFDVPYLSKKLGAPVVEWHELKRPTNSKTEGPIPVSEQLGCWSVPSGNKASSGHPLESEIVRFYQLDISYTPVPSTFTLTHGKDPNTNVWSIQALASLGFPRGRGSALPEVSPKAFPLHDGSGNTLEPNEHLLCYDFLYYTGIFDPSVTRDFFMDYSPYWNLVGVHMRWKASLVDLAERYLRRHFGIENSDPIPPFISVHVRHTDFLMVCNINMGISEAEECFAPISAYERRVGEVRERLKARKGIDVKAVIVTSDESDVKWWDQVAALGPDWTWVDHAGEGTVDKYGKWFPMLLDTVFQSMGSGFVGTDGSTMSELARKRVEDWNGGESALVKWGGRGADDH